MDKKVYQAPKCQLFVVETEEGVATGSTITVDTYTTDENVDISEYEFYEEGNKDFNINF